MTQPAQTAIHRRVALLRATQDPTLIARLPSGWAVLGEQQFLRGYALLLAVPVVGTFNVLAPSMRAQARQDAARLGDARLAVTGALRIKYAASENVKPARLIRVVAHYFDVTVSLRTARPWR